MLGGVLGPTLGSLNVHGTTIQTNTGQTVHFDVPSDVLNQTVKQAGAGGVGLQGVAFASVGSTGVLGTLGSLGINQTASTVASTLINPLLSQLDAQLLGPLTDLLGVNVVGSDLTANRIDCDDTTVALVG